MHDTLKIAIALALLRILSASPAWAADAQVVYPTYGVHNPPSYSPCETPDCLYSRGPGEPSDPLYPLYWSTKWTMYRVYGNYEKHSPPYDGRPPAPLKEGKDYEVSTGATYYDSTWRGDTGEGAMMEYYEGRCLPIFPINNQFSCAFISLGNRAFFVTYDKDRPAGMPPVCLFSDLNHPPRRDFIKHLPYSKGDSKRLGGKVQGYSFWVSRGGKVMQVGVAPDRTKNQDIMFGYGFQSAWTPDKADPKAAPYRHPQSFYFSGFPGYPPPKKGEPQKEPAYPFAPIVSQNYTDFAMVKPDPAKTWDQVAEAMKTTPPPCQLFGPSRQMAATPPPDKTPPTWGDIGEQEKSR
ncbi:hypothetical protein ATI61_111165 [Archangium gephyra]|uniref:Uncharacterized protein n=1 Tax=Archangium gephyra TaxID=48 RepID=A0AAC8QHM5_9BACT|nr:hypothetical protein [Archangium gephyra]AKJ07206.1 Hypothetical protein AA314_08832 [Archangium gephyra]REG26616.1 hypothetical protein ATI61_111165 [Archangium gephyra]